MGLFSGGIVGGLKSAYNGVKSLADESDSSKQKRNDLNETGLASNQFAEYSQGGVQQLGAEAAAQRAYLGQLASGQHSVSAEQLRQGLQQNIAGQRSMAASAAPANQAMAARTAAIQMGRQGAGLAGQQAVAGLQERQQAQQALAQMIMQQRQQDMQGALGSRQTAVSAYGGVTPDQSTLQKWANPVAAGIGAGAKMSDQRLKEDIKDGDSEANKAMKGLRAFTYKYRDKKLSDNGGKSELGIMAQDLESAGLKHAVIETPRGKAVHGAALATANTAMLSALERRVAKMEKK